MIYINGINKQQNFKKLKDGRIIMIKKKNKRIYSKRDKEIKNK